MENPGDRTININFKINARSLSILLDAIREGIEWGSFTSEQISWLKNISDNMQSQSNCEQPDTSEDDPSQHWYELYKEYQEKSGKANRALTEIQHDLSEILISAEYGNVEFIRNHVESIRRIIARGKGSS